MFRVCTICGHKGDFEATEFFHVGDIEGTFVRCPSCGVELAQPSLYSHETYDDFYDSNALFHWTSCCPPGNFGNRAWRLLYPAHRCVVNAIAGLPRDARILDLGCGLGWILGVLRARGFSNLRGLEIVARVAKVVEQKGIPVIVGDVAALPDGLRPDVVILSEVLEHLPDPVGVLQGIRVRLKPRVVLATTPSRDRWAVRMKVSPLDDWPPGHIWRWTKRALRLVFERAGYADVTINPTKPDGREVWLQVLSLATAGGKRGAGGGPLSDFFVRNVDRTVPVAGVIFWPLAQVFRFLRMEGRSLWISARTQEDVRGPSS
jgi:SAM-dependent methyltransferase